MRDTVITYKRRQIAAIRRDLERPRGYTWHWDSMADQIARLVDLEREVKALEKDRQAAL